MASDTGRSGILFDRAPPAREFTDDQVAVVRNFLRGPGVPE